MSLRISRRHFLGGFGTLSLLTLSGCSALPKGNQAPQEKWIFPRFSQIGSRVPPATPLNARPLRLSTLEALSGDGIFFFYDDHGAQFRIRSPGPKKQTYLVEELFEEGHPHGFSWGTGAVAVLKNGRRIQPEKPALLRLAPDGHVIISFREEQTLELHVRLEAYDISGETIREYLRTSTNMPTQAALFMGPEQFPAGSVAYAATLWVEKDELLAPSAKAFTGSETLEAFSKRYMKETPMCLRSLPGKDVRPIGILFEKPLQAKKIRRKGRWTEVEQTGLLKVYPTKRGSIFCQKTAPHPLGTARWHLEYVNGTRTLSVDIPDSLDALSFGMSEANRKHLLPGFSEEQKRRSRQVIPTYLWKKNGKIRDAQFRFNAKAARAVHAAILASKPKRERWEQENENEVTKRARALFAKIKA